MATITSPMKKFLNDPGDARARVAGRARGRARRPAALRRGAQIVVARRRAGRGQGRAGLGRRLGTRAAARRLRRHGHARRRLPGRGVHLAGARADARRDEGGRRRRRRGPHRQELHGRRDELQARRRGRRRRGHRRRVRARSTTTWRSQDSLYTAGRRGVGATVLAEKIAGAAAERGDDLAAVAAIARRVNERARSFGIALSSCTPPAAGSRSSTCRTGRSRSASASTASRAGGASRSGPRRDRRADGRGGAQRPRARAAGAACWRSSTAWAARRRSSCTSSTTRSRRRCARPACEPARHLVGNYITSLEMAGASLTLLELDDELTRAVGCAGAHARPALGSVSGDGHRTETAVDATTVTAGWGRSPRRCARSATT